jgi:hypothetical protein
MRSVALRVVAATALTAILACSGLGLCWQQIARGGHDCCTTDGALAAPAKACAAAVESGQTVKLAPPGTLTVVPVIEALVAETSGSLAAAPLSPLPPPSPPLVLRI